MRPIEIVSVRGMEQNSLYLVGNRMTEGNPKTYHDEGRTLKWGEDISIENMQALRSGEIFTLLNTEGEKYSTVLMDSYDQIRERKITRGERAGEI